MNNADNTIPSQQTGRKTDFFSEKSFETISEAHEAFRAAARKLLTVNAWQTYAGAGSAKFTLYNNVGELADGFAEEGALICIDLPIPGSNAGEGMEWVMIERLEAIEDAKAGEEFLSMMVRPIPEPHKTDKAIAHFYKDISTSTFIVKRTKTCVSVEVHGRNETPNNHDVDLHDKIRNTIVALSARIGLAGPQWKKLADGLLA